jgi:long-chain acyl-CoA synthetase
LIVPTFLALKEWCEKKGINYTTNAEMIQNAQVIDKFQREIDRYNVEYGHWEQVKKFRLLPKEFSIDAGEMTPKLSLKRKVIHERYSDIIEEIYK